MISPEHILQKHILQWTREAIAANHLFLAFDRSRPSGQWTHMREKARGILAGTPDTLLRVVGRPNIWCELKTPGNVPTPAQKEVGHRLAKLGDIWAWCSKVESYHNLVRQWEVPLHPNAHLLAMHHDAAIEGEIARARLRSAPKPSPRVKRLTTYARIAKARKAGVLV